MPLASLDAQSDYATPYTITTFAGNAAYGSADGTGAAAKFFHPEGIAVDSIGNVYVADSYNHTIRKITPAGVVTTFAGSAGISGSADGTGSAARFNNPGAVTVDATGNVYVADSYNDTIRKITPDGMVTTLAGIAGSYGSADGIGSSARFSGPNGIAVDAAGNLFVADSINNTIRKITSTGVVSTLAAGSLNSPNGVTVDADGNIYVADTSNCRIQKISSTGVVTTLAGSTGIEGSIDDTGSSARFSYPNSIIADGAGNVYVADRGNSTIRKITPAGVVTTFAGTAEKPGSTDGTGDAARFYSPFGVAVDAAGNLYVADTGYSTIRRISSERETTTIAGSAGGIGGGDGTGAAARFWDPHGVATDSAGNVYVADSQNQTIRKITPAGIVTTFAGLARSGGSSDGTGSTARFRYPHGVAVDAADNVYVADTANYTIRKITPAGVVSTIAGSPGAPGSTDSWQGVVRFNWPESIAVTSAGTVYVADTQNHTIRKIEGGMWVTTFAGFAGYPGSNNGTGNYARFTSPKGVATDSAGNVYVADSTNNAIRKITPAGDVTTLAGSGSPTRWGSTDGTGDAARFSDPRAIAVDTTGNVYVADSQNYTIRKITPGGAVTTLAGLARLAGTNDGTGSSARFNHTQGIAIDSTGNVYAVDSDSPTIRKGTPVIAPLITTQPTAQTVTAGNNANLSVGVAGIPTLVLQWQVTADQGGNWNDLSDTSPFSGTTTPLLVITGATRGLSGLQFRCIVANPAGTITSNSATLTVRSVLAAWRLQHFGTVVSTGDAADLADPDSDGRCNLLEYATATDPTLHDPVSGYRVGMLTESDGTHLTLTFHRIGDPALTYVVESSDDLMQWNSIWTSSSAQNIVGDVTVSDSAASPTTQSRRFLRLWVSY